MINGLKRISSFTFLKQNIGSPPFLTLFVTSKCNLRCLHCFNWKSLNKKDDLALEEIKKLSLQLEDLDSLLISGGEPFLRDDLPKIVEFFYKNNKLNTLTIPTNGFLTEKIHSQIQKILKIAEGKTVWLNFSLDGTEKMHDQSKLYCLTMLQNRYELN